jgi:hypothetical protein
MRNIKSFFFIGLIILFSNCKKETPTGGTCSDPDFCVLSKMPILQQGASGLPSIIKQKSGISGIKSDTGWCAPVSATMGIAGLVRETKSDVKFNNSFDQFRNFSKKYTLNSRTKQYGPSIYSVGEKMETDWKNGGTYSHKKVIAFRAFTKSIKAPSSYDVGHNEQSLSRWSTVENKDIVDIFKKHKPTFAVSWGVYQKKGSLYKRTGGHALIVNGYEDGYLKIYDPWGKVYNINIVKASGSGIKGRAEIRHISGDSGFAKSYSSGGKKVIFDSYNYLFAHKK